MPLKQSGSKKSFDSNLKAELDAGKPQKQALAIAYAVQRRNMAHGGPIVAVVQPHVQPVAVARPAVGPILAGIRAKKMASGGLDDDAPPLYAAYMQAEHHLAHGGESEDLDEDDLHNEEAPAPEEEKAGEDQQEKGRETLQNIMKAIRARHAGKR